MSYYASENIKLLIVDDDDVDRERIRRMLRRTDLDVTIDEAESVEDATSAMSRQQYHCVIVDYRLGKVDGLALLEEIRKRLHVHCAVVMLTGLGDEEVAATALRLGASDYLQKRNIQPIHLQRSITNAVHRSSLERKMHDLAHFDPLTGLINRTFFIDRLEQRLVQMGRDKSVSALCFLDLDNFKPVNDRYGHTAGDIVLKEVANRLSQTIRASDSVSRIGGDEYVLLLTNLANTNEIFTLVEKVQQKIAEPITLITANMQSVSVSASIGVTIITDQNTDAEALIRQADQSMYAAKRKGKNRMVIFDPDAEQAEHLKAQLFQAAVNALSNDEFVLYYQPKVDMAGHTIVGLEALIRWQHPEEGLLYPDLFLDALEDPDLGSRIGEWVINQALNQMADWKTKGHNLAVSINIAAPHFQSPDFVEKLTAFLDKHPTVNAAMLELEILETVSISDIATTVQTLHECREKGVKIALDDFGTGYSSLNYLKNLPLDTVKIDRSFVLNILENNGDMAIVKSIVMLAQSLGYELIAEGVETKDHETLLIDNHCNLGQGYSIAYPMPAKDVIKWVKNYQSLNGYSHSA